MRVLALGLALAAAILPGASARAEPSREAAETTIAKARAAMLVDPHQAQTKARLAREQIDRITDESVRGGLRATALWLEGEAAYRLKEMDLATAKLKEAFLLAHRYSPGSRLEGDILVSSGSMHGETGQVVVALAEFQRAHAIFLRLKDARNRAIALICIASLYSDAKDYSTALKYFDQALTVFSGDPGLSLSMQNNRAAVLRDLGRYEEAERGFRAALVIADGMQSDALTAQILRNIARSQLKHDDVVGANETIARGQALYSRLDAYNRQAMSGVAAQAAFQSGRVDEAATLIERSFAGVDPKATPFAFRDVHETAYRVFSALGRYQSALVHLLALKRLDDQTTRLATSSGAALMAARFDFANQELRIARLKANDLERRVAAERQHAATQRYIVIGGAASTALVILALAVGLIVVRRSRNDVRAANGDLALANAALGKALAAKTEFLATTSHEIRTPLNGILGMTQVMLADPMLPAVTRDRLSVVHGAGTTMRALVDDILDVAKMETGKLTLETAPFDLAETILDATRLWEAQAASKNVAFVRTLDICPGMVCGDAARVRQIVFNLLSNALKFTTGGEIAIGAHWSSDGRAIITVRDTGIGIAADKLEAIFESFRQADAGTTRQFGGTGLGLAICRQLARAMGGDVGVESELGQGSVFTVTLPLNPVVDAPGLAPCIDQAAAALVPALLILDCNPITRSLFRTLLMPHAARIVFAEDAAEAALLIGTGSITRVLIDDATVRSGDLVSDLRTIVHAARGRAAVTLLLSKNDDAERARLDDIGIDCIATRPIDGPSLVASLFRQSNDQLVMRAA
ncbi:ATP-binding protein [Sphingomonas sp.]|uniref:ATP-binding protein n=1 Tax=Sphingomonas sp. TaxID=28214 RepID=UPI002EDA6A66